MTMMMVKKFNPKKLRQILSLFSVISIHLLLNAQNTASLSKEEDLLDQKLNKIKVELMR